MNERSVDSPAITTGAPSRTDGMSRAVHIAIQHAKTELTARFVSPMVSSIVVWAVVAILAIIAIVFLYVLADRYLADRMQDPVGAAAVLAGVNLVIAAVLVLARSSTGRKP